MPANRFTIPVPDKPERPGLTQDEIEFFGRGKLKRKVKEFVNELYRTDMWPSPYEEITLKIRYDEEAEEFVVRIDNLEEDLRKHEDG